MKKPARKKQRPKKKKSSKRENDLFNQVIKLSGIPSATIKKELKTILDRKKIDTSNLTLEQLRAVVASYLREIMGGVLDRYNDRSHS